MPNVPWGAQSPLVEILVAWGSVPFASFWGWHVWGKDGAREEQRGASALGAPGSVDRCTDRGSDPSTLTS